MKSILIIDSVCYKPYTFDTLRNEALGGTEATVLRVARLLANHHSVNVLNGSEETEQDGVKFIKTDTSFRTPNTVIHLRTANLLPDMSKAYPLAKQIVWHHDLGGSHTKRELPIMQEYKADYVFVSKYHKTQFIDRGVRPYAPDFVLNGNAHVIYNPVDAKPAGVEVNKHKLIYPSSPHKGLEQTIAVFKSVRDIYPNMKLYVANPGYLDTPKIHTDGVKVLGTLPHSELLKEVESSLALFSMNHVFPETMGLVYAEANAVGTPCIAHPMGALPELLDARQLVDTRSTEKVLERLKMIVNARPEVKPFGGADPKAVEEKWLKLV